MITPTFDEMLRALAEALPGAVVRAQAFERDGLRRVEIDVEFQHQVRGALVVAAAECETAASALAAALKAAQAVAPQVAQTPIRTAVPVSEFHRAEEGGR